MKEWQLALKPLRDKRDESIVQTVAGGLIGKPGIAATDSTRDYIVRALRLVAIKVKNGEATK